MLSTNKLTQKSIEAVERAQNMAVEYQNMNIDQQHLLYSLLDDEEGLIPQLMKKMEVDSNALKSAAGQSVSALSKVTGSGREPDKVYISQELDKALTAA